MPKRSLFMICDYGCGQQADFISTNGKRCCSKNAQSCPQVRKENSERIKKAHAEGKCTTKGFDKDGARDWAKGKNIWTDNRIKSIYDVSLDKIFAYGSKVSKNTLKNGLIYFHQKNGCFDCDLTEWRGKKISIELHHINGNPIDNRFDNLTMLCPNCHSITDNFRNKKNKQKKYINDDIIADTIPKCTSIRQLLKEVGLSIQGGGHYARIRRIMKERNISLMSKIKTIYPTTCLHCNNEITNNTKTNLCKPCQSTSSRKSQRPPYEQLKKEIKETSFCAVGRKYNVSDNAIRKWLKQYEKINGI